MKNFRRYRTIHEPAAPLLGMTKNERSPRNHPQYNAESEVKQ
jgi:hypothetical protein